MRAVLRVGSATLAIDGVIDLLSAIEHPICQSAPVGAQLFVDGEAVAEVEDVAGLTMWVTSEDALEGGPESSRIVPLAQLEADLT